jgi:integrase
MEAKVVHQQKNRIEKFCSLVALDSKVTAGEYSWRLRQFEGFLTDKFGLNLDGFFEKIGQFDVYDVMADFHIMLRNEGLAPGTIAGKLQTVKSFLEFNSVPVSNTIYRLRVRAPRRTKNVDIQALSKEMVRKIILEIKEIRLQTYVLLLATTGMRASEALSIRVKDIDFEAKKVSIRAEFTKTRRARYCYLTDECIKQLKTWMEYRERERVIVILNGKGRYKVKRTFKPDDPIFDSGHHKHAVSTEGMYAKLAPKFVKTLDRMGLSERHNDLGRRHNFTLHSFRRFVKSTISDLGYQDYSEWFIGHAGSTYYRKTESEKLDIFKKIEPYLTYLDYSRLEAKGADTETKLEQSEKEIEGLKQEI